jgi:hypothetical protein
MALRKHSRSTPSEFPILKAHSLYPSPIRGDGQYITPSLFPVFAAADPSAGNCLFNALSDQMYGHQGEHRALRDATIAHMRVNADFYRQYMVVNPVRRNPKRKTARALAKQPVDFTFHTEEELQEQFELHLQKMGQPGEWADNMEVSAFASALNVHVRLWQADFHYTFTPRVSSFAPDSGSDSDSDDVDERPVLNIAYHVSSHA